MLVKFSISAAFLLLALSPVARADCDEAISIRQVMQDLTGSGAQGPDFGLVDRLFHDRELTRAPEASALAEPGVSWRVVGEFHDAADVRQNVIGPRTNGHTEQLTQWCDWKKASDYRVTFRPRPAEPGYFSAEIQAGKYHEQVRATLGATDVFFLQSAYSRPGETFVDFTARAPQMKKNKNAELFITCRAAKSDVVGFLICFVRNWETKRRGIELGPSYLVLSDGKVTSTDVSVGPEESSSP